MNFNFMISIQYLLIVKFSTLYLNNNIYPQGAQEQEVVHDA